MLNYVIRRMLLMVVTLFGITVVTLGIARLTPGDPAQLAISQAEQSGGKANLSRDDLERFRKRFGVDKPPFFNINPTDRLLNLRNRVKDYEDDNEAVQRELPDKLALIGAAGLEPAFSLLKTADDKQAGYILKSLPDLARGLKVMPGKQLDRAGWERWWQAHGAGLQPDQARVEVETFLASGKAQGISALRSSVGTLANERLMGAIGDSGPERRALVCRALAEINRKPNWRLDTGVSPSSDAGRNSLEEHEERWRRFWNEDGASYTDLTTGVRWLRCFTETHYATWMGQLFRGDLGESTHERKPVLEVLPERIKVTLLLAVLSILLAYLIAIPLGIYSASKPYTLGDRVTTTGLFILYSLPSFWVGNLMILFCTGGERRGTSHVLLWSGVLLVCLLGLIGVVLLAEKRGRTRERAALLSCLGLPLMAVMGWVVYQQFNFFPYRSTRIGNPTGMADWLTQTTLPLLCYTYASFAYLSRQMRASMMETIRADFIRTARAKGLPERVVVLKHALRNSLIPILTIMANVLPALIGGSVIIEQVFEIQGMGKLAFESVFNRDYPVVMAIALFSALLTLVGILLSDVSYALADPRISYS